MDYNLQNIVTASTTSLPAQGHIHQNQLDYDRESDIQEETCEGRSERGETVSRVTLDSRLPPVDKVRFKYPPQ